MMLASPKKAASAGVPCRSGSVHTAMCRGFDGRASSVNNDLTQAFCYTKRHYHQYLKDLEAVEQLRVQYGPAFDYLVEHMRELKSMLPNSVQSLPPAGHQEVHAPLQAQSNKIDAALISYNGPYYLNLACNTAPTLRSMTIDNNEVKVVTESATFHIRSRILTQTQ